MTQDFSKLTAIRGMNDLLPDMASTWLKLEGVLTQWLSLYGYRNIRTPVLEHTRLFTRGIGEVTDIVEKEMYTFTDALNGDSLTLRPEFTAGVVRAAIEHHLLYDRPQRVYTSGPVFRHERPQRGRYRQFHQLDVEALGLAGPDIDAEMIVMTNRLWQMLGIKGITLELNTLGQSAERLEHRTALIEYLEKHRNVLDEDGLRRLYTNPLRVLDTKNPAMQDMANGAPKLFDFLGSESRSHFDAVCQSVDDAGIAYVINPRMVRGLDYYNLTVFEWVTDLLGAQATVCGGGRYDGLIEMLGGRAAPAVGMAFGLERLVDLWSQSVVPSVEPECQVYVVHQGDTAQKEAFLVSEQLRDAGIKVIMHAGQASFKSQFKRADASGAAIAVILASDELAQGAASVKRLRAKAEIVEGANQGQQTVALDQLVDFIQNNI
jgi:histidyl-tRNA synthetase